MTELEEKYHAALEKIRANMWRYCLEYPDYTVGNIFGDPVEVIIEGVLDAP